MIHFPLAVEWFLLKKNRKRIEIACVTEIDSRLLKLKLDRSIRNFVFEHWKMKQRFQLFSLFEIVRAGKSCLLCNAYEFFRSCFRFWEISIANDQETWSFIFIFCCETMVFFDFYCFWVIYAKLLINFTVFGGNKLVLSVIYVTQLWDVCLWPIL